jgi:hypothetical protein
LALYQQAVTLRTSVLDLSTDVSNSGDHPAARSAAQQSVAQLFLNVGMVHLYLEQPGPALPVLQEARDWMEQVLRLKLKTSKHVAAADADAHAPLAVSDDTPLTVVPPNTHATTTTSASATLFQRRLEEDLGGTNDNDTIGTTSEGSLPLQQSWSIMAKLYHLLGQTCTYSLLLMEQNENDKETTLSIRFLTRAHDVYQRLLLATNRTDSSGSEDSDNTDSDLVSCAMHTEFHLAQAYETNTGHHVSVAMAHLQHVWMTATATGNGNVNVSTRTRRYSPKLLIQVLCSMSDLLLLGNVNEKEGNANAAANANANAVAVTLEASNAQHQRFQMVLAGYQKALELANGKGTHGSNTRSPVVAHIHHCMAVAHMARSTLGDEAQHQLQLLVQGGPNTQQKARQGPDTEADEAGTWDELDREGRDRGSPKALRQVQGQVQHPHERSVASLTSRVNHYTSTFIC